jgi:hypothetical protein
MLQGHQNTLRTPGARQESENGGWVKPNGAILFSCIYKFLTSFAEFSKVTSVAYAVQAISSLLPFPLFSYHAAIPEG